MSKSTKQKQLFIEALAGQLEETELHSMWRWLEQDERLEGDSETELERIIQELQAGSPFQYVLREAWFLGMKLYVDPAVLIPRPETEELADHIIRRYRHAKNDLNAPLQIMDIGTGSGCLALSLKKNLPMAEVYAVDVSAAALAVARKNAHDLDLPIHFLQLDILEWDLVVDKNLLLDVIVSNPPYITPAEKQEMEAHVLDHEPELALFITEEAPLLFYQHIAAFAMAHLHPGGRLFFEINSNYGQETTELLRKMGYQEVQLRKDMQGLDRMIEAKKSLN